MLQDMLDSLAVFFVPISIPVVALIALCAIHEGDQQAATVFMAIEVALIIASVSYLNRRKTSRS